MQNQNEGAQVLERAKIDHLVPGGQGIATLDSGQKAFIWNALEGETVEFFRAKNKASYCEGIAKNVLEPSPDRIVPRDDCYLATSPWQILDYNAELKQKSIIVKECFAQQHLDLEPEPTITDGRDFFYRNKMEYSLYYDHASTKIYPAFHMRGTHQKLPIKTSSLERPEIFKKAEEIFAKLNATGAEARDYQSLLIRCDQQGKTSAALLKKHQAHPTMSPLSDTLLGQKYSYSPNGFFQINLPVYELALKEIAAAIKTNAVLDLYAGVGSIGLSVTKEHTLTLVEINKAAYKELENNANTINSTNPPRCIFAKSEEVTDFITTEQSVILDPPRAGCDQKLINRLLEVKPRTIIYLSCNPITQARDLKPLLESSDYVLALLRPFNFFPRTPHIENLAILHRK